MSNVEHHPADSKTSIHSLVTALGAPTAGERIRARKHLVEIGVPAVPQLIQALGSEEELVRFEAAKVLGEVRDPRMISALVEALYDPSAGVRWLVAEALGAQGPAAVIPILAAVQHDSQSNAFCDAAHHALHELACGDLQEPLAPVLDALGSLDSGVRAPIAAGEALKKLGG